MTDKCTRCLEEKPVDNFAKNKTNKRGYAYWCKPCMVKLNAKRNQDKRTAMVIKYAGL